MLYSMLVYLVTIGVIFRPTYGSEIDDLRKEMRDMETRIYQEISEKVQALVKSEEAALEEKLVDMFQEQRAMTSVAFSAYLSGPREFSPYDTIIFDINWSDAGSDYSTQTGIFTAPVSGYYYFSFSTYNLDNNPHEMELMKSGTAYSTATGGQHDWDSGASSAVLYCSAGDTVYLRHGGTQNSKYGYRTAQGNCIGNSFSGFLLS